LTVPELPSFTVTSLMASEGCASSLTMVPAPDASAIEAPEGEERPRANVSSASNSASPVTATLTVRVSTPGANVSVPEAAE
jgi:hypothetical protein